MKKFALPILASVLLMILANSCNNSPVSIYKENNHYFSYHGKPVILITSDHHYGAVIDRDFDYEKFLDWLSSSGMNLTRIYPGGMFEPPDKYQPGNPLGPEPGRQILPWAKSSVPGANPLLAEPGKPSFKFDLEKWNPEYFTRLRSFVSYAGKKGIIVEIPFFNGMYNDCWPIMPMYHQNNIQNIGNYEASVCGLFTSVKQENADVVRYQKEYIKKITSELNEYDNVIYDICDEPSLQGIEGGGVIFLPDSQVIPWVNEMKDAFTEAELPLPRKHLLGQTVQNLSPDLSDQVWCKWLPTEYVRPAANALEKDYVTDKPLVDVESNFFGISLTKNPYNADAVRVEGWWFMLAGGAGCINLNGEYHRGQETGGITTMSVIVPQKKILKDFISGMDLARVVRSEDFRRFSDSVSCNMLAERGRQYALYLFHASYESEWGAHFATKQGNYTDSLLLTNVPSGRYLLKWINPVTGKTISSKTHKWEGGDMKIVTPPYRLDIAFKMTKRYY